MQSKMQTIISSLRQHEGRYRIYAESGWPGGACASELMDAEAFQTLLECVEYAWWNVPTENPLSVKVKKLYHVQQDPA